MEPNVLAGGKAIRYGAAIILDMRKLSIQAKVDPIDKTEGVKIGVTVKKNHVITNRFPYVKVEFFGLFGVGTEKYLEALQLGQEKGLLTSGAWINFMNPETGDPFMDDEGNPYKWNGKTKFRQYCIDNPEFFERLQGMLEGKVTNVTGDELEEIKKMEKLDSESVEEDDILEEARK